MANTDFPHGFKPAYHRFGAEIRTNPYVLSGTVYKGDVVKRVNDGTIVVIAAGDLMVGVAAEYGTTGQTIQVYDDPNIVFEAQMDTSATPASTDIFSGYDICTYLAGDTTTKVSKLEIASSTSTTSGNFVLLGLVPYPDNEWGTNCKAYFMPHEHAYIGGGVRAATI